MDIEYSSKNKKGVNISKSSLIDTAAEAAMGSEIILKEAIAWNCWLVVEDLKLTLKPIHDQKNSIGSENENCRYFKSLEIKNE